MEDLIDKIKNRINEESFPDIDEKYLDSGDLLSRTGDVIAIIDEELAKSISECE